jgi:hypothetical protein
MLWRPSLTMCKAFITCAIPHTMSCCMDMWVSPFVPSKGECACIYAHCILRRHGVAHCMWNCIGYICLAYC